MTKSIAKKRQQNTPAVVAKTPQSPQNKMISLISSPKKPAKVRSPKSNEMKKIAKAKQTKEPKVKAGVGKQAKKPNEMLSLEEKEDTVEVKDKQKENKIVKANKSAQNRNIDLISDGEEDNLDLVSQNTVLVSRSQEHIEDKEQSDEQDNFSEINEQDGNKEKENENVNPDQDDQENVIDVCSDIYDKAENHKKKNRLRKGPKAKISKSTSAAVQLKNNHQDSIEMVNKSPVKTVPIDSSKVKKTCILKPDKKTSAAAKTVTKTKKSSANVKAPEARTDEQKDSNNDQMIAEDPKSDNQPIKFQKYTIELDDDESVEVQKSVEKMSSKLSSKHRNIARISKSKLLEIEREESFKGDKPIEECIDALCLVFQTPKKDVVVLSERYGNNFVRLRGHLIAEKLVKLINMDK